MEPKHAKYIVMNLCNSYSLFKGVLIGRNAWNKEFPDNNEQLENMAKFFEDLAQGVRQSMVADKEEAK